MALKAVETGMFVALGVPDSCGVASITYTQRAAWADLPPEGSKQQVGPVRSSIQHGKVIACASLTLPAAGEPGWALQESAEELWQPRTAPEPPPAAAGPGHHTGEPALPPPAPGAEHSPASSTVSRAQLPCC